MTHQEFQNWLQDEVQNQRMTSSQMNDLLTQKTLFDNNRTYIELTFQSRVVGYVNDQMRVADTLHNVLNQSIQLFPGRMIYFEPIGFDLL